MAKTTKHNMCWSVWSPKETPANHPNPFPILDALLKNMVARYHHCRVQNKLSYHYSLHSSPSMNLHQNPDFPIDHRPPRPGRGSPWSRCSHASPPVPHRCRPKHPPPPSGSRRAGPPRSAGRWSGCSAGCLKSQSPRRKKGDFMVKGLISWDWWWFYGILWGFMVIYDSVFLGFLAI